MCVSCVCTQKKTKRRVREAQLSVQPVLSLSSPLSLSFSLSLSLFPRPACFAAASPSAACLRSWRHARPQGHTAQRARNERETCTALFLLSPFLIVSSADKVSSPSLRVCVCVCACVYICVRKCVCVAAQRPRREQATCTALFLLLRLLSLDRFYCRQGHLYFSSFLSSLSLLFSLSLCVCVCVCF